MKALHHLLWFLNPNNHDCTIVGGNPGISYVRPDGAAAPQGAAPSNAAQDAAVDTSSDSLGSGDESEQDEHALMGAVPAPPAVGCPPLEPHGLPWSMADEYVDIDAREGSNFTL